MPNIGQKNIVSLKEPSYFSRQIQAAKRFYSPGVLSTEYSDTPFLVLAGGWESCAKGYRIERSGFPFYALEFVIAGHGRVTLADEEYDLIPGVFFSYGPDISHTIESDGNKPLEKYFVTVRCADEQVFLGSASGLYGTLRHSVRPHSIQQTFEELIHYGIEQNPWSTQICGNLVHLLALKMAESSIHSEDYSGIAYSNYLRCVAVLNRHYLDFAGLEDIASACSIDVSYLCRLFKKFSHQSPYQYFLRLNMNHAADLLLQKGLQVQEVAEMMNYGDPLHFSRTFRKVMGVSPTQFIKLSKGDPEKKADTDAL